jgi:phosphoribosylanthranilate isomerase
MGRKVRRIFPKVYLAGGLSLENVNKAILQVRPFGVDACSSVEMVKGIKSQTKVRDFIFAVK